MRGRSHPVSASKFELKQFKLSNDNLDATRAPILWKKPDTGVFDYHFDVAGMYYQPMIAYCMEREQGGPRRTVELPDRMAANYDKRVYSRLPEEGGHEEFLTEMYKRRAKANHSRTIHVENERWARSKKTTDLNVIRGSANMRDRYLCQIQLIHTGQVAKERCLGQRRGSLGGEALERDDQLVAKERSRRSLSADLYSPAPCRPPVDPKYGPNFQKKTDFLLDSRDLNKGASGLAAAGIPEPRDLPTGRPSREQIVDRVCSDAADKYEAFKRQRQIDQLFIESDTSAEFNMHKNWLADKRAAEANTVEYKPLYNDTSYIRALSDVQKRVKGAGRAEDAPLLRDDINIFYRRRRIEDIGKNEKASITTNMHTHASIPQFELGYDTVERSFVPVRR